MGSANSQYHVVLNGQGLILNPYGHSKVPAPLFGARVSGGDPSYNSLNIWQHWTQTCWAGGLGADEWTDDSMYTDAVGIDTTIHERAFLSRDLTRPTGGTLNAGSLDVVRKFYIFNGVLYCLTLPAADGVTSYLWGFTKATSTWALVKTFTNWRARCIFAWNLRLVIGGEQGQLQHAATASGTYTTVNPPAGVTDPVTALGGFNQRLYVAYGQHVWRRKADFSLDGSTVFYDAVGTDVINNFKVHLSALYFSSRDGHVFRTDSNNTFDIWAWDAHTYITTMQSYDGKLFIGTYEYTDTTDLGQGVLYQLTGSAMTQLKRWGGFARATSIGGMIVYDRKLYYGASGLWQMNKTSGGSDLGGFGVAVYDSVEDAHSIWATNKDTTTYPDASGNGRDWVVDDVAFFGGILHASVRKSGLFVTPLAYRDFLTASATYDTTTTTASGASSTGFIRSSDYDGGTPGLLKLWKQILLQADLVSDNVSVKVYYSLDKGLSWSGAYTMSRTLTGVVNTTVAGTAVTGTGTFFRREVQPGDSIRFGTQTRTVLTVNSNTSITLTATGGALQTGVAAKHNKIRFSYAFQLQDVRSPRMQYRLELNTTNGAESPVVRGISISYLPQPEPNWMWKLQFNLSDKMQLLDGTVITNNVDAIITMLDGLYRGQRITTFTDIDGVNWEVGGAPGVIVYDYQVNRFVPSVSGQVSEATVYVTLLETAESY